MIVIDLFFSGDSKRGKKEDSSKQDQDSDKQ